MSASSTWSDDRVETLKRLWRDGLSASQIARSLGGVSRNAVIGKIHRLGLCGRAAPHVPGARQPDRRGERRLRRPSKRPAVRTFRTAEVAATADLPLPATGQATLLSVRYGQCRWPMGDPLADDFCLCGRKIGRGAYCDAHAAVAYRPAPKDHLLKLARTR
jgi:GcrA cell cycle regulator